MGAGAVANAVGSQIINVFIGLGLPYAIAGAAPLNTDGAKVLVLCLLACIVSFVASAEQPPRPQSSRCRPPVLLKARGKHAAWQHTGRLPREAL